MAEIESCNKKFWIYNKICLDLRNIGVDGYRDSLYIFF